MGCLFRCFCITSDVDLDLDLHLDHNKNTTHPPSDSPISSNTTVQHQRNRLSSLLLSETETDDNDDDDGVSPSLSKHKHHTNVATLEPPPSQHTTTIHNNHEGMFLKSCQTILETPNEFKKTSGSVRDLLSRNEDSETPKSSSTHPKTSVEKLQWEGQSNQLTPEACGVTNQCKTKSVRFEFESDKAEENSKQPNSPGSCNVLKHSPYPTPLKLSDEMQTPGTVYPICSENLANGGRARIRSQYVYNVLNPVQNSSQLMEVKEADPNNHQQVECITESLEQSELASSEPSLVSSRGRDNAFGKVVVNESLSQWLKPQSSPKNDYLQNRVSPSSGGSHSGKTPDMDRPILGTVAAHWNDEEPSRISPKWWDGNGIPNSTNKYNEDQKVSWHATPFVERLEKALSNESLVFQRNVSTEPIEFAENEESDTAVSRLAIAGAKHPESVVSF
ncbi:Jason-like protein [Thalictrum thalictroides]|uniref:Jason-like protein n=1 Tax=Thalictrum thalictroides TaxID=46969 RepID=A0A7J6WD19_THATH|nr:Jason-like protein [Thalictrum thalictroides]